jgi:hypothetical protein
VKACRIEGAATKALVARGGTAATHLLDTKITGKFVTQKNNSKAAFTGAITLHFVKVVLSRKTAILSL